VKPLEAKTSNKYFSRLPRFSFVGGKGIVSGRSGVAVRFEQGAVFSSPKQSPWHDSSTADVVTDADDVGDGKLFGITPKPFREVSERYNPRAFLDMCTICRVTPPPTSILSNTAPTMPREESVIPTI
jgi:hypothetical protein